MQKVFTILLFIILFWQIPAQNSNIIVKKVFPNKDTIVLDSNSILNASVRIKWLHTDAPIQYQYVEKEHKIILLDNIKDTLAIEYIRLPFNFEKEFYHKKISDIHKDLSRPQNPFQFSFSAKDELKKEDFFSDKLYKNGSISRGISFGNNQDMSVQSNLNLQMNGKLSKDIDIAMVATDNNIPFQPDGTTAQLQEFDKVYIQLSNKNNKLIVGDYQLAKPENDYFMNYFKRLQGANFENKDSVNKNIKLKTSVAFALTRGKFSRNVFYGKENNQGPYRLTGADGELIITVLSGTEKIYIDGKLMQRGQEYDYIIDYNTAEIIFTAKQQITKDKRIIAEFQYVQKNFSRSLYYIGEDLQINKNQILYFHYYSEQDNKNRPLQQDLTNDQKLFLYKLGDSLDLAYYSGAVLTPFNNSDVFYRKKDTIVSSISYKNIYEYSTNPDSAKYKVTFSYVGTQKGNYKQITSAANGKVFQWVAPTSGIPQGDYEPIVKLNTPQKQQMLTTGYQYTINPNHKVQTEFSYTTNDVNTFSPYDKRNDDGYGTKVTSSDIIPVSKSFSIQAATDYEYVSKNFTYIQRYRSAEFQRDWNRPFFNDKILTDQHIGKVNLDFLINKNSKIYYGVSAFSEGSDFFSYKHLFGTDITDTKLNIKYDGSYLSANTPTANSVFYRHRSKASVPINAYMQINYTDNFENNIFWKPNAGIKYFNSYQFWEWESSISSKDTTAIFYKLFYRNRKDKHALSNEMKDSTEAHNYGIQIKSNKWTNHQFNIISTYRILELKNIIGNSITPDNALLSRVEYYPKLFGGFMQWSLFYETGYGLENKKEYYYVEVTPPQGQYTWIDYNNDGIKQLNEFELAQYPDQAKYIRVYVPTTNYVKVLQNQLTGSVYIRPNLLLRNKQGSFVKFVKRWNFQTAYRNDNKSYNQSKFVNTIYSDFNKLTDTALISASQTLRQSVFFNQSGSIFGADYNYLNNTSKQLLTNGYDAKSNVTHELKWRYNILRWLALNLNHSFGNKTYYSGLFSSRNYDLAIFESEQKIIYQPSTNIRISLNYKYTQKNNQISLYQKGLVQTIGLEGKIIRSEAASINVKFNYIKIKYNDNNFNSPVSYEILQSLQPGNNYTWNVSYQQNITSYLQINIIYDGRKSSLSDKIIHTGSAQIRAYF